MKRKQFWTDFANKLRRLRGEAPQTIRGATDEYKATRELVSVSKLLHKVLGKIIGLKCPYCGKDVPISIED